MTTKQSSKEKIEDFLMLYHDDEGGVTVFDNEYDEFKSGLVALLTAQKEKMLLMCEDYMAHKDDCILSSWSAGRPTKEGGYESNFGGKWYQARPIDKTPKCNCGLDDLKRRVSTL